MFLNMISTKNLYIIELAEFIGNDEQDYKFKGVHLSFERYYRLAYIDKKRSEFYGNYCFIDAITGESYVHYMLENNIGALCVTKLRELNLREKIITKKIAEDIINDFNYDNVKKLTLKNI